MDQHASIRNISETILHSKEPINLRELSSFLKENILHLWKTQFKGTSLKLLQINNNWKSDIYCSCGKKYFSCNLVVWFLNLSRMATL